MCEKKVYEKCYGCDLEMDLTVLTFHVEFNDGLGVNACSDCVRGWFEEIPGDIIKVEAI